MIRFVRICFVFLCLISTCGLVNAQYFSTGQDPASINWKQINTDEFQIIFPQAYEEKAKYMAAIFQDLLEKGGKDLEHQPKKFSVVVHTHSATSNGMVAWAPKRMEIFNTSAPDNDSQFWIDHVSTHEYRHVIQIDKMEQGFTRIMNYIFGQQATMVVVGLYLPPWFLEGDAVCTETALGESGRGRSPFFEQELRAQLLEKGNYSYDKAINGSYKNYATDRYKLGYYLVGKARAHYGDQLWEQTLTRVARKPLGITSFADGIKKGMNGKRDAVFSSLSEKQKELLAKGINVEDVDWAEVKNKNTRADGKLTLYYDTMKELQWEWQVQDAQLELTKFEQLSNREKYYTNIRYPHKEDNGDVIVLKEGMADAAYFEIIRKTGGKEKLYIPGYDFNTGFDYADGKLIWSERKDHLRWEKADKSVLVVYDAKLKNRSKIKHENSLFGPAFSENGKRIVAVETDDVGNNYLLIINTENKRVEQRISANENEFILSPKWDGNKTIVYVSLDKQGKQLVELDLASGNKTSLFKSGSMDISQLEVGEGFLFFTANFTGIDNIFTYQKSNGKVYQVTSSRFGGRDPHVNGKELYYSDYTSDGYLPVKAKIETDNWKDWDHTFYKFPLAESLSDQLGEKLNPDTTNMDRFEVKKYSKLGHLFNFHSWAPVFIDGLEQKSDIGVSVASQNKLSTLFTTLGYKKEEGYDNGQFYVNMSYQGMFPIIDSKLTVGKQEASFATLANRVEPQQIDTILVHRSLKQWNWESSISLPFNLSGGKYSTKITPKVTYSLAKLTNMKYTPLATTQTNTLGLGEYDFGKKNITQQIMEYQLFAYNIVKMAPRDVQYQWAQVLELNYRHTPFGDNDLGETYSAEAYLYFPGVSKHHGTKLYGAYQNRSSFESRFSNMIKSPRGMSNLYGEDILTLGFDYAMPLAYPDWNVGPLAYFKRIKMNSFVDFGYQKGMYKDMNQDLFTYTDTFLTFGTELSTDLHVLRFSAPVDLGIRVGYENQSNNLFTELLVSFSLSAF